MEVGIQRTNTISDHLRHAASKGNLEEIIRCLQAGATFDIDQDGRTALHYAALNGFTDVTKFLLEKGCEINVQDASGYTALHRAASQGHIEVITALVERGCDVNTQDEHGNAAIHEAAWNGFSKTLELLVKFNVNVSIVNKAGFTALHLSAQNGHNESSRVLLYAGCNSDIKNNYGDTTLHTAARYGHAGVTRILISARVKINEQNKNGDTALHIAAALKRRKIAKLLVESGSDVSIRNKQNETAADVARRKDHREIIVIIQAYSRPVKSAVKEVNFKADVHHMEGPVVVPDMDIPEKIDTKADRGKRFLFFKKKKQKEKTPPNRGVIPQRNVPGHRCNVQTTPVQGFFSKYVPREGVQYYRDLAGNVKQGPVGYTPTCNCLPAIHRLEKQVHDTQDHVYGQLQSTNRVMQEQINQVDHRSTMRLQALEKYTQDRFVEEENLCRQRINEQFNEHDSYYKQQDGHMKSQIQNWLEQRLEGYGHCLHHHHDDSALPNENIFSEVHETANGRLFKSRSDETLSQSDNHSGKFRKREFYESRQQAMQQIRAWQVPSYSKDRSRVKVLEKQRNNQEQTRRFQSRQELNKEIEQRQYPVEPKIEIRTRPQSQSAERNNNKAEDNTYMTMTGPQSYGAIPKQSALPQPQVYPNTRKVSGSRGPMGHSTPKSRESSPYTSHSGIVRSQTDGVINKSLSLTLQQTFERKDVSKDLKKQMSVSDKNLSDRSYMFPNQQQSSSYNLHKPESNSVSVNSPYRNSTSSDNFVSSVQKPTFSTFGYEDDRENQKFATLSSEQKTVDQTDQCEVTSSSTPRANSSNTAGSDDKVINTHLSPDLFSRQNSQGAYGFSERNNDNLYVEMRHMNPRLHQHARSSEGLLETDIDHINVNGSEERTLELQDSFYTPTTTRSSSATRDLQTSISQSPNSKLVSQQQSRISSPRQQPSFSYSSPHPSYGSSPYTVQSETVRSLSGPPTLPKPSVQSSLYPYSTAREVMRNTDIRYNGSTNGNNKTGIVNGNVSESAYSTVKDVQLQNNGNHNIPVVADIQNPSDIYYRNPGMNNPNSNQKQTHMEPRSKTAYQTYLTENPNFSSENLYREHSPNICNNSKEDSSSNPDSGYSSKIYGNRANSVTPASLGSTPSSSFSTDRGLHSNTNSPHSQYSNADYECLPNRQYEDEVQTHVQSWYQRKIQETTQKVYDNWRSERSPGKVTQQQQNGGHRLPVRYYGNSDYAKIDYSAVNGRHSNVGQTQSYTPSGQNNHMVSTFVMHGSDV
ncbi:transcription initiation factor TFIID subunit 1-like isoform X2 [Ruditapes philippinarum]|nr:transcription initiation factor TFIID subunit 1-like isoform X2 [Ruditapes philippinarum]XP_060603683.1 transcription initiation factor TFIID subunit 1-like isoform X2 [Ruditapes philippinarum]XP_060603684.1 transcription initiation factor TFIID subunit 1-like isoform X2 [Ruditapes philippinarum]XP_060603685.1 transcription initiation factor TFIID subunit 1-like isoform X2 [Ruditapes philippinarum]XP_060603686.1 transcription initiation factor TFIID subunit 1-like isoform X2 [Ruditapes phili